MHDVIVVGAGPGGSTAAAVLAKSGFRTLLIDREEFPREKACGDAVPATCIAILRDLGMGPFDPEEFFDVNKILIQGPKGVGLTLKLSQQNGASPCIVSRYVFDETIHQFAIANGAEQCNMLATGAIIEDGKVVGVTGKIGKQEVEYRAKVVIAADGATSAIARALKSYQRPDKMAAVALRGYIETDKELDRLIEFVFLDEIQPGYAWFFPMSNHRANVGVGMRSDFYKRQDRTLNEALDIYLKTLKGRIGNHRVESIKSWQIPLFADEQKRTFNGALLIGDAGGFVDPLTGAGIYQAVATATYAAQAVMQASKANDFSEQGLNLYETLWRQDLAGRMKRSMRMHNILSAIPTLMDGLLLTARVFPPMIPALIGKI